MTQCSANFEAGVNGNAITNGAGEASPTKWDTIIKGAGNLVNYDNTHSYDALAGKFNSTATPASDTVCQWSTALGTLTDHYGRLYVYLTANPSAGTLRVYRDTINNIIGINTTGKVQAFDLSGTAVTTTTSVTLNAWVRIEYHLIHSATVGQWEINLFNSPDSGTATETKTSTANRNSGVSITDIKFGLAAGGNAATIWLDNIVAGATSYPGPATPSSPLTPTGCLDFLS